MTINGQPDGRAIYAVAAIAENNPFYGYGIGQINGSEFTGNTSFGAPFAFRTTSTGLTGSVGLYAGGKLVFATGACFKVW